ncbi:MAG: hypothetical protein HY825_10710 [Acidobacteria bacterium]|nr:hypothetical protein [Acidobacteriota bacterium]
MTRREIDRLLWDLVDGSISAADRARVEARLAGDAAAREQLAEIRSLSERLASVEELPVPEALPAGVERALAGRPAPPRSSRVWAPWLDELFTPRWRVRLAWSAVGLAVGVACGVLLLSDIGLQGDEDVARFYGSVGQASSRDQAGLALELSDRAGRLTLRRDGQALLLDLEVTGRSPAPVVLEIEGSGLAVEGLLAGGRASVEVDRGASRIAMAVEPASRSELRVTASGDQATVTLRVTAGEGRLLERTLRLDEIPPR